MAAAECLIFCGARGPAKGPKESKALKQLKELKDPTVLEEPKVLEKPKERKELKKPNVLKDPKAYRASSIVVCNYFVLGVKAYGATSTVECKLLRLGREGVLGHFDGGVQADSTDLLREKALAELGPSARMCSPGSDCTVVWQ